MQTSAQAMRRPLISVKSNLVRFYKHGYQQTYTIRSAAVAFALGGRTRRYLYASSYSYSEISAKRTGDIGTADPILLPLLKSETTECFSAGAAQTRVEKSAVVSENELARKSLDVCIHQWPNCSRCWKCARTLLTLELLGKAEAFSSVFDLSTFGKVRDRYIAHVLVTSRHNAFARELRALMRAIGFRPSLRHWLKAALIYPLLLTSIVPRFGNGIRRLYLRVSDFPPDH
jgi:hypothetical protein